jgi:hypothetical protein
MAKLASNEYLLVHSQPKEDRHDIDDASSGKVYDIRSYWIPGSFEMSSSMSEPSNALPRLRTL